MKKITSVLALVMALVMCVGLMAACTGNKEPENTTTQKPGTTTGANKDEATKPETKPEAEETKPEAEETKPEAGETQPEAGETEPEAGETKPEAGETKPEGGNTEDESSGK